MDELDKYVEDLRQSKGPKVPSFSTEDGRTNAKILFLLQDPGKSGASKTNIVDRDNHDPTAKRFREVNDAVGLDRKLTISWNTIPWPISEESTFSKELEKVRSEGWLEKLLEIISDLQVVVLLGNNAHRLTQDLYANRPKLHVLHGPHPAQRGVSTLERRQWLEDTVRKARDLIVNCAD